MDDWENELNEGGYFGESFGVLDIIVFGFVMVSTWRNAYPKISLRRSEERLDVS